jgi:hypothetical protein
MLWKRPTGTVLRHGAPCYFDGEDVTSALIARAEVKIRALDKLIAEQDAEAPRCMGPPPPAEWTHAARGWVGLSC